MVQKIRQSSALSSYLIFQSLKNEMLSTKVSEQIHVDLILNLIEIYSSKTIFKTVKVKSKGFWYSDYLKLLEEFSMRVII